MCEYRCSLSPEDFRSLGWSYWCVSIGHWEPNCPLFGKKKSMFLKTGSSLQHLFIIEIFMVTNDSFCSLVAEP